VATGAGTVREVMYCRLRDLNTRLFYEGWQLTKINLLAGYKCAGRNRHKRSKDQKIKRSKDRSLRQLLQAYLKVTAIL
jgi:hypothetical protein